MLARAMPRPQPDAQGFLALWPTLMLQRRLPGHEHANRALQRLILEMESAHGSDLTTDYRSGNLLAQDNPAIAWLKDCINKSIVDLLTRAGMRFQVDWGLQGWANVNRFGDYHDLHNHPHAYLSGTYYVAVPKPETPVATRPDARPGCITFYDPRGAVNMTAIRDDPQIEAEHTVQPEPGMILLWPAFLHHFVHPNLAEAPRISISFNAVLKWSDAYLPDQR